MRITILYIYTIISYIILYPFTFFSSLIILLLNIFDLKKAVITALGFWAYGSFLIIGKTFKVEGRENLNTGRKYILMANHASMFDIMGIMATQLMVMENPVHMAIIYQHKELPYLVDH